MKKNLHIARNGQVIGQFESDKIGHLMETGRLLPSDHYFDDSTSTWIALTEWKEPKFRVRADRQEKESKSEERSSDRVSTSPPPASASGGGGSRSSRASKSSRKKGGEPSFVGWIACLFAIVVAAGIWIWSQSLGEQIAYLKDEKDKLETSRNALKTANDALNEISPSGSVRGIIIYEPAPNQTAIVSGATVGLYNRAEVEKAVESIKADATSTFPAKIEKLKTQLPSPLQVTLTDSNGRINFSNLTPGDYILVASAAKGTGPDALHFLWLAGFKASDRPSLMMLLDEKNAISERNTDVTIRNVPTLALPQ